MCHSDKATIKRLRTEIKNLKAKMERVFNAGYAGISHVGAANYAEREAEAKKTLTDAMYS